MKGDRAPHETAAREPRPQAPPLVLYGFTQAQSSEAAAQAPSASGGVQLSDPARHIPFAIANHFTEQRVLTQADFRIDLSRQDSDGSIWLLNGRAPLLLHVSPTGQVLEAPIELPYFADASQTLRFPDHPLLEPSATIRIMNAVASHAAAHGGKHVPVCSPWELMLSDGNAAVSVPSRKDPPPGSGLGHANSKIFAVKQLQEHGIPVVTWTVNDKQRMLELMALGVNGIISDRPDLLREAVEEFTPRASAAGSKGGVQGWLDEDGLLDPKKFDAQGHRGARNLRPENTLPAMEAALDWLMSTLETDAGVTADGAPVLSHDPVLGVTKCRRTDGKPYNKADERLIKDLTLAELQSQFIADNLLPDRDRQTNDVSLSPVSVRFAADHRLPHPYAIPSVEQLFQFTRYYAGYYGTGPGAAHADAKRRSKNAARVRFNIETKINPRREFRDRTVAAEPFARALAGVVMKSGMQDRAEIQSFDFRTLLLVQEHYPAIRTVHLFGDFPLFADPSLPGSEDGTNLQPEGDKPSPWLAGLAWPYRSTAGSGPVVSRQDVRFLSLKSGDGRLRLMISTRVGGLEEVFVYTYDADQKTFRITSTGLDRPSSALPREPVPRE